MPKHEELLKEIRERFQACTEAWSEIRSEAQKDMRFISGDPWDPAERKAREDAKRPCLALDELNQYTNQLINNLRQNKRGIKVNPVGAGATDKTAELRENIIRGIEYKSKAQAAYITAYENAVQRSYGYFRINADYVSETSFDQEICIKRIPNPDTVWPDPDGKEADGSDWDYCFVTDVIPRKEFKRKYPKATIQDFQPNEISVARAWFPSRQVQIAEYWKVKKTERKLLLLDEQGTTAYLDEYPGAKLEPKKGTDEDSDDQELVMEDGKRFPVLNVRECEDREVCQYITNGIEILEEIPVVGKYIRIVPVFGKEIYVDDGSGSKRMLLSLIRLGRDPQMGYNYLRTREIEEAGLTPLVPFQGYEGQFEGHEAEYQKANREPIAFLQAKAQLDATGTAVLPLPTRTPFTPNFQAYELAAEGMRRSIMSAMGISPLPTAAQRQSEKSGVALERIEQQQDIGSFHFPDNFERSLEHAGRIINDLIPLIYDTTRDVGVRKADETHAVVKINSPHVDESGQEVHHQTSVGEHEITISSGPSYQSQREEVSEFANLLLSQMPQLGQQVIDLIIKMRDMGPLGDEMAERLTPPAFQKNAQNNPAALQQQLQQAHQVIQAGQAVIQQLQQEKQAKVVENEYALKMKKLDTDAKVLIAEIQTKAQEKLERGQMYMEVWKEMHGAAHETAMQAGQQSHEQDLAQQAQQAAQVQAQQQQSSQGVQQ
jgi:Phage P22-like portal protein